MNSKLLVSKAKKSITKQESMTMMKRRLEDECNSCTLVLGGEEESKASHFSYRFSNLSPMMRAQEFLSFLSDQIYQKKNNKTQKGIDERDQKIHDWRRRSSSHGLRALPNRKKSMCVCVCSGCIRVRVLFRLHLRTRMSGVPSMRSPMFWIRMRTRMSRFIRVCVCGYIHVCVYGVHMGVSFCSGIL
jgi:hypothetical protein